MKDEKKRYAKITTTIKITPNIILITPPDSSWMILFNPSPIRVRPKRLGNTSTIYKNCGSVGNIKLSNIS